MNLRKFPLLDLLFGHKDSEGVAMSSEAKGSKSGEAVREADSSHAVTVKERPTVTTSGQVIWSTRDLLFPSGHTVRSVPKK